MSVRVCEHVFVHTYKQESNILQHIGVVEPVGPVLPVTQHINTRLALLQRQVHVVPTCTHIQYSVYTRTVKHTKNQDTLFKSNPT